MGGDDRYKAIFTPCLVKMDNNISFSKWDCLQKMYRMCKTHMYNDYKCKEIMEKLKYTYQ